MDLKMEIYTPLLELVGILEVHRSVIWEEKAFGAGSFSVDSLITEESKTLLVPGNIVWISENYAGIIEYVQEQSGKEGPYITVKGPDLTGILGQRILWGQYNLTGTAPAIMHSLVNDSCISPTRGDTEARKIPGLVSLDVPTGGDAIRVQKTGGTLLEALEELGAAFGVAFGVRFNPAIPRMEFWTRWGQNLGINQDVNDPVFYSTELDDVLSSEYSYNAQDYRNVALVAGEGDGGDRVMITVNADVAPAPIPPTPGTKYTITLSVDPEGGGTVTGGGEYKEGSQATVTATPNEGYRFVHWIDGGGQAEFVGYAVLGDNGAMQTADGKQFQVVALTASGDTYHSSYTGPQIDAAVKNYLDGKTAGVSSFNGRTGAVTPQTGDYTAAMVEAVPTTRTVNGKALATDIALTAEDVGAVPDTVTIPTKTSDLTNDSDFTTTSAVNTAIQTAILDSWGASY